MKVRDRYPEKHLQLASVERLKADLEYQELFDDVEATGARVDSVGLVAGRLWLIEYKVTVSAQMVRFAPTKGSCLESKISGTLGPLYRRENDRLAETCNRVWDRTNVPVFAIVAKSFSEAAIGELASLYAQRGEEWYFELKALQWNGERHSIAFEGKPSGPIEPDDYHLCTIEALIGRQPRRKNMNLANALVRAEAQGVGYLFAAFVEQARCFGIKLKPQIDSVSGSKTGGEPARILGCYFDKSSATEGLLVGFHQGAFQDHAMAIGAPSPIAGFMNTNRYLRTVEEVSELFAAIRSSKD